MSELMLVTIPVRVAATEDHPALNGGRVVGVAEAQSATYVEHGYKPTGLEAEEPMAFPGDMSERIADFYQQTLARMPEDRPYYDCHLFAFFAIGKALTLQEDTAIRLESLEPLPDGAAMDIGEVYVSSTSDGIVNHSVIGTADPSENLSVIGARMPLIIADHGDMLELYQADRFNHLLAGQAIELPEA